VLDGRRIDQTIGRITWKRRRQRNRSVRNSRRHAERAELVRQAFQPRADRNVQHDALMTRQPRKLEPGYGRDRKLVSRFE
jgi:hypothetical protein